MNRRYDVKTPRPKKDGSTYWFKIGSLFVDSDKDEYTILLDALPVADEKQRVVMRCYPPRDMSQEYRDAAQPVRPADGGSLASQIDDDVPFYPEVR